MDIANNEAITSAVRYMMESADAERAKQESAINKVDITDAVSVQELPRITDTTLIDAEGLVHLDRLRLLDDDFVWWSTEGNKNVRLYALTSGWYEDINLSEYGKFGDISRVEISADGIMALSFEDDHELLIVEGESTESKYSVNPGNPQFSFLADGNLAYIDKDNQLRVTNLPGRLNLHSKSTQGVMADSEFGSVVHKLETVGNLVYFEETFTDLHHEKRRNTPTTYIGFSEYKLQRLLSRQYMKTSTVVDLSHGAPETLARTSQAGLLENEREQGRWTQIAKYVITAQQNNFGGQIEVGRNESMFGGISWNILSALHRGVDAVKSYKYRSGANLSSIAFSESGDFGLIGGFDGAIYYLPLVDKSKVPSVHPRYETSAWVDQPKSRHDGGVAHFTFDRVGDPNPGGKPPPVEASFSLGGNRIERILACGEVDGQEAFAVIDSSGFVTKIAIDSDLALSRMQDSILNAQK